MEEGEVVGVSGKEPPFIHSQGWKERDAPAPSPPGLGHHPVGWCCPYLGGVPPAPVKTFWKHLHRYIQDAALR